MKSKEEVHENFLEYFKFVNGKLNFKLNTIQTDHGTEFENAKFDYICDNNLILHIYSSPR
jgi:hypothetical protein